MNHLIFSQSEPNYIHDSHHEKIILDRFGQIGEIDSALRSADADKVWDILSKMSSGIHEVNRRYTPEEENPYQTFARLITVNVILAMSCTQNGVHPLYVHSLSRRYDKKIARCTPDDELPLIKEMIVNFCQLTRYARIESYGEFSDQVIRILLSSLAKPPSLEELAAQMYVSTATVTRRFKKETGQTIPEFLNRSRIRIAMLYMQEESANLGQIALQVGFYDASYFSKVFRRYAGMSPKEYLQQHSK